VRTPKRILDRRRSVRIEENLPFRIGHEDYETEARTLNISSHGALCVVDRDIPLMTQLKIGLSIPSGTPPRQKEHTIRLKGVVVRKEEDGVTGKFYIAVYFSNISPKDLKTLQDYVEHRPQP